MRRIALACLAVAAGLTMTVSAVSAQPLTSYRWDYRPLLVFAPSAGDPAFKRQVARLNDHLSGLRERDMAVMTITGTDDAPDMIVGPAPSSTASDLREAYDVGPGMFAVVLVGKDGGEKDRWSEPVDPDVIFARIDSMPMRRREMREGD